MNLVVVASAVEALTIAVLLGSWLWLNWKRKQKRQSDVETLLADIEERQSPREHSIAARLVKFQHRDRFNASAISHDLIIAEKRLLQTLVTNYLLEQPINQVYQDLCLLLDHYLLIIDPASIPERIHQSAERESEESSPLGTAPADELIDDEAAEKPPEPDWGDVFD